MRGLDSSEQASPAFRACSADCAYMAPGLLCPSSVVEEELNAPVSCGRSLMSWAFACEAQGSGRAQDLTGVSTPELARIFSFRSDGPKGFEPCEVRSHVGAECEGDVMSWNVLGGC